MKWSSNVLYSFEGIHKMQPLSTTALSPKKKSTMESESAIMPDRQGSQS